ncbi:hypothetical protein P171DRAFT_434238 [Karstenula rhodostoma CBS 690.94]|uniref:RRM domain-containing protein n=1 Tax=Karstenula rhodostoma CBS 690.94 TaxID=1392251 RepID=A0A9P4PCY6_9PLEO|nr:hypothetical protein P171DRAFT_434238 [Karstenula rhodostoma CBS 690.94]
MALPRVCSLGRGLVFRGTTTRVANSVFLSARITVPHRSFVSASRHLQEAATSSSANSTAPASQASIPEEQQKKNARSVKVFKIPRRASRSTVEATFTDAGFQVADVHMNVDRFRYEGDTYASVELANEQQVQKAINELNGNKSMGNEVYIRALNPEFDWDNFLPSTRKYPFFVREDKSGIKQAVMPLFEGRRVRISVKSPSWGNKGDTPAQRRDTDLKVLERAFDQFGIESISRLAPQFGETTFHPKFYCHIDFTTKQGADEAIQTMHDKEFEGVLVWAKPTQVDAAKAYQIGRLDKGLLAELQEKGLAPPDSEIHEDWVSKTAKKDPKKFDRHRNWTDKTNPPQKRAYRSKNKAE